MRPCFLQHLNPHKRLDPMSLSITTVVPCIASAFHQPAPSLLQQETGRMLTGDADHNTFIANPPFRVSNSIFSLFFE